MQRYESSMLLVGRINIKARLAYYARLLASSPQIATSRALAAECHAVSHVVFDVLRPTTRVKPHGPMHT